MKYQIWNNHSKKIKESKKCKKIFKKARAMSIVQNQKESTELEERIWEIKEKIAKITKMNLKEYIDYKNGKDEEYEEKNKFEEEKYTMMEEVEKKINQIEEICCCAK